MRKIDLLMGLLCAGAAGLLFVGCGGDEVVEYTVPKEVFAEESNLRKQMREARAGMNLPHDHDHEHVHVEHGHTHEQPAVSGIAYETPDGWTEQPLGPMRRASFLVADETGNFVDISVTSFPGDTGGLHANINRWREQIHLQALPAEELDERIEIREIHGDRYLIVDIPGADEANGAQRILGAIHPRGGNTWFFKLMGDDELTAAQREPLLSFLESVKYESEGARDRGY